MPDFDRTPDPPLAADNYLMSFDIVQLIKAMYIAPPSGTDTDWTLWYDWVGCTEAECFFTPPNYPVAATHQLGYPEEDDEDVFEDRD